MQTTYTSTLVSSGVWVQFRLHWRMLTYVDIYCRMMTYDDVWWRVISYVHLHWCMISRMLTYRVSVWVQFRLDLNNTLPRPYGYFFSCFFRKKIGGKSRYRHKPQPLSESTSNLLYLRVSDIRGNSWKFLMITYTQVLWFLTCLTRTPVSFCVTLDFIDLLYVLVQYYPCNPVYERSLAPSVLVFSLSSHRHPSICIEREYTQSVCHSVYVQDPSRYSQG